MRDELPNRKRNRLPGFDYSRDGVYFITICVKGRHALLGKIVGAATGRPRTIELSDYGCIVDAALQRMSETYETVKLDAYVIMPNHVHMIIRIGSHGRAMRAPTISTVVNQFKGYVSKKIGFSLWQKLFHDRIIRNQSEYQKILHYIHENPEKWTEDCYYEKG